MVMGLLDNMLGAATQALGGAQGGGPDWAGLISGLLANEIGRASCRERV